MHTWIIEGNRQRLDGGSMFGNAPKALWSKWNPPDESNRILLSCRALLVQTSSGKNILFETGIGNFFEPKLKERFGIDENEHVLLKNLEMAGFKPHDIDSVILSHLHFDHAGGLLSSYAENEIFKLVFPKASFYVGQEHWMRAQNPHIREQVSFIPIIHQLLKDSQRLRLVEGESHPDLDFGVKFHYSHGHTIGLMISEIFLEDTSVFFVSDLIPGKSWVHLPIVMGYDRFPEQTVNEKKQILEKIIDSKGKLFFTHDPEIAFAHVQKDSQGKFFIRPLA